MVRKDLSQPIEMDPIKDYSQYFPIHQGGGVHGSGAAAANSADGMGGTGGAKTGGAGAASSSTTQAKATM